MTGAQRALAYLGPPAIHTRSCVNGENRGGKRENRTLALGRATNTAKLDFNGFSDAPVKQGETLKSGALVLTQHFVGLYNSRACVTKRVTTFFGADMFFCGCLVFLRRGEGSSGA